MQAGFGLKDTFIIFMKKSYLVDKASYKYGY